MILDPVRRLIDAQRNIPRYTLPDGYLSEAAKPVNTDGLRSPLTPPPQPSTGAVFADYLADWRSGSYGA